LLYSWETKKQSSREASGRSAITRKIDPDITKRKEKRGGVVEEARKLSRGKRKPGGKK